MTSLLVESLARSSHLEPTHRVLASESTSLALPRRSIYKSEHLTKGSQRRDCRVVSSRKDLYRMEVHWLPPVDPRKTYVSSQCFLRRAPSDSDVVSGLWEKRPLVCLSFLASSGDSLFDSSSITQNITFLCEAGSAIMAYFYFDSKDLNKQTSHDLLRSLIFQLSTRSSPCDDILHHMYKTHEDGAKQPTDDRLKEYLQKMLRLPGQGPIFIILDALDECPESPGIPSPRNEVLQLVKELVDLHLKELHICITSQPEVDIQAVFKPLASHSVSLHDEGGQKTDIADYVRSVVNLSPSTAMRTWGVEDKTLVIDSLTERADGM